MRFTILLTLCVLGVASAHSLAKRDNELSGSLDNIFKGNLLKLEEKLNSAVASAMTVRNKRGLRENVHDFVEHVKESFEDKVKALKDFFSEFRKNYDAAEAPEPVESETAVPESTESEAKTVEKRDVREDIQNFLEDAKAKAKDAGESFLKDARAKVISALQKFLKDAEAKTQNVGAEIQKVIDHLFEMAEKKVGIPAGESQNVAKRDLREQIQNFINDAQVKAKDAGESFLKDARAKIISALQKFLKDAEAKTQNVGAEVQKAIDKFFEMAEKKLGASTEESQNVVKRDIKEQIQSFLKDAQAKAKDAGENFLKDAQAKLMQAVQQFLKDAQSKAANVGAEVQKVIDQLFDAAEKKVGGSAEESQNVAKRDLREQIQSFLKDGLVKDAGENFLKEARAKIISALQKFLKDAEAKTQNVGAEVQKAIDHFFEMAEKKVGSPEVAAPAA